MRDLVPKAILRNDLQRHPAVLAWSRIGVKRPEPDEIQVLKGNKSEIYRLRGSGPNGSNVIAKRCRAETALKERAIYREVLPCLPLLTLRCFGFLEDDNTEFRWLFLEDAGTQPFQPELLEHRRAFAQWLGILHGAGQQVQAARSLPARGPAHFLEHLRLARAEIERNFGNPALTGEDRLLLKEIIWQCDHVEAQWGQLELLCERMPRTFVHCDLKRANMRVRETENGLALLCFDWETGGWGLTGPDLVKCPDLHHYRAVAHWAWPELGAGEVAQMVNVGRLFVMLAEMHWESCRLQYQWVERPRLALRACHEKLAEAIRRPEMN